MSLSEIENKLYKREFDKRLSQRSQSDFDAAGKEKKESVITDVWGGKERVTSAQKKAVKAGIIALGIILLVATVFVGIFKWKQASFSEERVNLSISGPEEAGSGQKLIYVIKYTNDNRADIRNVSLKITYPENFKPEDDPRFISDGYTSGTFALGDIPGRGAGEVAINGKAYSPKGALMYLKAELLYSPSGFNSQFASNTQLGVTIASTPVNLEIFAPANISSADAVDYLVEYKNEGEVAFEDMRVRVQYPDGFSFSRSDPASFSGNDVWYVGELSPGQSGKIVVSGKLEGERDQVKSVRAYIGVMDQGEFISYSEEKTETNIVASPLIIVQTVNDKTSLNVNAGDELRFVLKFKNEGEMGLRDVIVTEKIESPVLDYDTLRLGRGAFDFDEKRITWKASDFPILASLQPGQEGKIKFSIQLKKIIPVNSKNDKNFVISSMAKIDSPYVPTPIEMNRVISGNKLDIRLNSKIVLDTRGFYHDALLPNSGPIPPKVGQETTYTIHWRASNISNDVEKARVETVLPTDVLMTGNIYPQEANLSYNERTNAIVWDIGSMKAGTGVLSSSLEVAFQVKIKPSSAQEGHTVDLVGPATFSASDNFTGEDLSTVTGNKNSALLEDTSIGSNGYMVSGV